MNCWEFMNCGKEKGGHSVDELGVCPAYPGHGRHCVRIAGTLCAGRGQGAFSTKLHDCLVCDYYNSKHYDRIYGNKHCASPK